MISRKIVKSNASRVQPSHAADQASHCSLVGSFHHAMGLLASTAIVMVCSSRSRSLSWRSYTRGLSEPDAPVYAIILHPGGMNKKGSTESEALLARRDLDQATESSASSILPFVSGPRRTAPIMMIRPTIVVTRIGPDKATWREFAYCTRSGPTSPPQIAPW